MALFETGDVCIKTGTYYCIEHPNEIVKMNEGEKFPECKLDHDSNNTFWIYQYRSYRAIEYKQREKSAFCLPCL